ncbi:MAG: hypothetical protein QOH32_2648 [Bradyrhizobium sp.]|jgi:hypothetical protein|nr:hypothetical protein [Bradyrhizobium sp.]
MWTETDHAGNSGIDAAFWSVAAVLGVAIVYVACLT